MASWPSVPFVKTTRRVKDLYGNTGRQELDNQTNTTGSVMTGPKIIKRYQNRKLYDTQQSCYVTLDDIAKMIRNDEEVTVVDNKTKRDITASTLSQIIFEAEKKVSDYAPLSVLREIIQHEAGTMSGYLAKLGVFTAEKKAQEREQRALDFVETTQQRSYDDVKSTLDARISSATERAAFDSKGGFDNEPTPELPGANRNTNPTN